LTVTRFVNQAEHAGSKGRKAKPGVVSLASSPMRLATFTKGVEALDLSSNDDIFMPTIKVITMRTTLALDDNLVAKAQAFTGLKEKSALVREALKALIERESARRLARLGGSEPDVTMPRRRRAGRV
jgi:Arc/MetJ family transcription regulator